MRIATIILATTVLLSLAQRTARAQTRYENSLSFSLGAYAADGFGTNRFVGARYNYYFLGGRYFVEGSLGFGSMRSAVLDNVTKAELFESQKLIAYEFVGAYDHMPNGVLPYLTLGVAGINQGGQSRFAGVIGLGKRIQLVNVFNSDRFGVRYDIRDHIFSQTVNNSDPFIAHNLSFTIGIQYYF
jgi:hypothetical protein